MKRSRVTVPQPPSMDEAVKQASGPADRSMLAQYPYAEYISGFGWNISSRCFEGSLPNGAVAYQVAVLPDRYFQHVAFALKYPNGLF